MAIILVAIIYFAYYSLLVLSNKYKWKYTVSIYSFLNAVFWIVITAVYSYDTYILPDKGNHDGIPITGVMRFLAGDDTFLTDSDRFNGLMLGLILIFIAIAVFIFSLLRKKKKD